VWWERVLGLADGTTPSLKLVVNLAIWVENTPAWLAGDWRVFDGVKTLDIFKWSVKGSDW
jgi:hypothetical protein